MTRKDFVVLADALKACKPAFDTSAQGQRSVLNNVSHQTWRDVANKIADVLQADNARFDRVRFALASGIDGKAE